MAEAAFKGIQFTEAIGFMRRRLALSPGVWLELVREMDAAAQDQAAGMGDAMVESILDAVTRGLEEGTTAGEFRKEFDAIAIAQGWKGDNTEGWRSTLTFRVQTALAMAAGRWQQIQRLKGRRPYLRYVTAGDHRVRDAHAAWHDVILDADDPWWHTHFPPNGFNCRCHVQQLNGRDLVRYGLAVSEAAPDDGTVMKMVRGKDGVKRLVEVPKGIDPGFAFNAGEVGLRLQQGPASDE